MVRQGLLPEQSVLFSHALSNVLHCASHPTWLSTHTPPLRHGPPEQSAIALLVVDPVVLKGVTDRVDVLELDLVDVVVEVDVDVEVDVVEELPEIDVWQTDPVNPALQLQLKLLGSAWLAGHRIAMHDAAIRYNCVPNGVVVDGHCSRQL